MDAFAPGRVGGPRWFAAGVVSICLAAGSASTRAAEAPAGQRPGAYLGVRSAAETDHGGARITHVVPDSPADRAGLAEEDIVVAFDARVIRGPVALSQALHEQEAGARVNVSILRDGRKLELGVVLGARPALLDEAELEWRDDRWKEWERALHERLNGLSERLGSEAPRALEIPRRDLGDSLAPLLLPWSRPKLGVELVETTPELREHFGGTKDSGVLVSKVLRGTPAERSGIAVGDLIVSVGGRAVASVDDLRRALADQEGREFPIVVVRAKRSVTLEVRIPEPQIDRPTGPRAGWRPPPPRPPARPAWPSPPARA